MAVLASFSSRPSTKRQQALLALPKVAVALKRLPAQADADEVLAAVVAVISVEMGVTVPAVALEAEETPLEFAEVLVEEPVSEEVVDSPEPVSEAAPEPVVEPKKAKKAAKASE